MKRARTAQRGVALITAVLVVALATMLAVSVGFRAFLDQRRTATTFALDQAYQVALGGEAWAADVLRRDLQQQQGASSQTDNFTEEWATPIPPIPIDGPAGEPIGEFEGVLEDMQGRFNINNLVTREQGGGFVTNQGAVDILARLLTTLEIEPRWASIIADWVDPDTNEGFPDGAEDFAYTSLTPAYRTANMPITRTTELLALPEFGLERFQRLEPFITALPIDTALNLCTAPFEVLDALIEGSQQFVAGRESGQELRAQRCFPNLKEFKDPLSDAEKTKLDEALVLAESSGYFRASIWVTIGSTQFTLYSLLARGPTQLVRPILRSYGTL